MNPELEQDLRDLLHLSRVDTDFITQNIAQITALFAEQGEWAKDALGLANILDTHAASHTLNWHFQAAELEAAVKQLLGEAITFAFPDHVSGDELYPYVQQALAPQNRRLCQYWKGDKTHTFLLFSGDDYARVKAIADKWQISLCAIDDNEVDESEWESKIVADLFQAATD